MDNPDFSFARRLALTVIIRQDQFNKRHPQGLLVGRFCLSVIDAPDAFERQRRVFQAMNLSDPWARLAAAYHIKGDETARDAVLSLKPLAVFDIAKLS